MQTCFITIGNQKGGAGKTTTTMLLASLLHAKTRLRIAVVDVDPQATFTEFRKKEIEQMKLSVKDSKSSDLLRAFSDLKNQGKEIYPVIEKMLPQDEVELNVVFREIDMLKTSGKYDFVFFDFPGYVAESKFIRLLIKMDVVLVPFYPDNFSWPSTMTYIKTLHKFMANNLGIKKLAIFGFRYSKSRKTKEFDTYMVELKNLGIEVMDGKVYDSTGIEDNRSTINPYDLKDDKSLELLCTELVELVGRIK